MATSYSPRAQTFELAVLPHLNAAHRLARWLTSDPVLAEDIVQDACTRALRYFGALRGENGRPWFLRIVRNTAYTQLARSRAAAEIAFDDMGLAGDDGELAMDFADPGPGPEMALIMSEDHARLDAAMAALPAHLRECFMLRYKEDRSYREIAQLIAAPVGTVMSRLHRARSQVIGCSDAGAGTAAS